MRYKLFRKVHGEWQITHLYDAITTLLAAGKPLRSRDLNWIVSNWHAFVPLMSTRTNDGVPYFKNETKENGASYWTITKDGYNAYVKEIKEFDNNEDDETKIYPKPEYLNDTHYYECDIDENNDLYKIYDNYINEDTDDWDEADMPIGSPKDRYFQTYWHAVGAHHSLSNKVSDAQQHVPSWYRLNNKDKDIWMNKLIRRFNNTYNNTYRNGNEDKKITRDTLRFVAGDDLEDIYTTANGDLDYAADMLYEILD